MNELEFSLLKNEGTHKTKSLVTLALMELYFWNAVQVEFLYMGKHTK